MWQGILDMTKSVSDIMSNSLPNFWKIAKAFLDGKYKKVRYKTLDLRAHTITDVVGSKEPCTQEKSNNGVIVLTCSEQTSIFITS